MINTEQFNSLLRSLAKAGGTLLAVHGARSSTIELLSGIFIAVMGVLWSHFNHAETPTLVPIPSATQSELRRQIDIALKLLVFGVLPMGLIFAGCAELDPDLPGTSKPAPLVAFTNGSAYLLGHVVTSNQVYQAADDAASLGVSLLLRDSPGMTNYLAPAQVILESFANAGVYNADELQSSLAQISLSNAGDQVLIDNLGSMVLSLAGVYVGPLATGGTNSGPYVKAALLGVASGL